LIKACFAPINTLHNMSELHLWWAQKFIYVNIKCFHYYCLILTKVECVNQS